MDATSLPGYQPAPAPLLARESLYVGIDVGKAQHVAGFVSATLLARHQRFDACPALRFDNAREGFRLLVDRIREYVPLAQCFALLEKTGHYHKPLEAYLLDLGVSVYVMHVQRRPQGLAKTDKRDALGLANHLFNQLEKGVQWDASAQLVRRALPPSETALCLKSLVGHRHELVQELTRRRNKLTAICDQLFPEFARVFRDPNSATALAVRERFPTPAAVRGTEIAALREAAGPRQPSRAALVELQALAARSIGVQDAARQRGLLFEQGQLIREVQLLREHQRQLDAEVLRLLEQSREGRILRSIPSIGPATAAAVIAAVGNIGNFPTAAALKAYFGWAPKVVQSGVTRDSVGKTRAGERTMKRMMYLAALRGVREDGPWRELYERLVPKKCAYDERTRAYTGKVKVLGRVAGQMIGMFYAFLKADAELLAQATPDAPLPEPQRYDPAIHRAHRAGQYHAMKPAPERGRVIALPRP